MLLLSCHPQRQIIEIPVETVRTEYIHNTRIDSVYMRDSIDRWMKDDTVFIYKERTKYKYLNNTDTIIKTDTIPKIIKEEVVKEVEVNKMKWYQETFMWIGVLLSLILAGYIVFKIKIK